VNSDADNTKASFNTIFGNFSKPKQDIYEKKILSRLGSALGIKQNDLTSLPDFVTNTLHGSVGIGTRRLSTTPDISLLLSSSKELRNNEIMSAFSDVRDNWPEAKFHLLVFDHHGDGIPDMVLHDHPSMLNSDFPYLSLRHKQPSFVYLQTLKALLEQLNRSAHIFSPQ